MPAPGWHAPADRGLPARPLGPAPQGRRAESGGWQENPDAGTVTIQDATHEFDVALEDADFATLHQLTSQWDGWPTAPESLTLMAKLDAAKQTD